MRSLITILITCCFIIMFAMTAHANVYVVFYTTTKGKTGHTGIAIDNYKIVFKNSPHGDSTVQIADTVVTGELTYYDLWPDDDQFNFSRVTKNIPALYYKLPISSTDEITLNSLYDRGIPHREHYPSDGLLKIRTNCKQDKWLTELLDSMISENKPFNAVKFNCTDFVRIPVEKLLNQKLSSKEFVVAGWSTTPNKFYRTLRKQQGIEVVKSADQKASHSFVVQRIIYKIFHRGASSRNKSYHINQQS